MNNPNPVKQIQEVEQIQQVNKIINGIQVMGKSENLVEETIKFNLLDNKVEIKRKFETCLNPTVTVVNNNSN